MNKRVGQLVWLLAMAVQPGATTVISALSTALGEEFPDDVLKFAIDSCEVLPLDLVFFRSVDDPKNVQINVFNTTWRKVYRIQDVRKLLVENPKLNSIRQTTIYVHGWRNTPTDESSQAIVRALLTMNTNVLVFDASRYMKRLYLSASSHVFKLGEILNQFLIRISEKVPVKKIHLIGFSLGAHISGVAGKLFLKQTGKKLERITALDPAKPCFEHIEDYRLHKEDAKYVEVIHTNSGTLGLREPIGHVDIYVNGISGEQPECGKMLIKLECNHAQSWRLFSSWVRHQVMTVTQCGGWEELSNDRCLGEKVCLKYGTRGLPGMFYMNTSVRSRRQKSEYHWNPRYERRGNKVLGFLSRLGIG